VDQADVIMENFTPGTMDRLGIGYETLNARNPRIIFASTSGFGQTGPYRDRPALDIIVQAMGGVMSITGEQGGRPVRPGVSYGDIVAGLYTAVGILAALQERERSGLGQALDISMLDCQVSVLENAISRYTVTGEAPAPLGTRHPTATPFQAFPTADGYIVVALAFGAVDQWVLFCSILNVPELTDDERFNTGPKRTRNHAQLEPLLEAAFRTRSTAEWLDLLLGVEIPCGPIKTIPEVLADPQVIHRGMIQEVTQRRAGTIKIANTPLRLSRSQAKIAGPPADLGEHTGEVLASLLGLGPEALAGLVARGVVATEGGPDIESLLI
jgi:CoA:oxalate CoA-transferase